MTDQPDAQEGVTPVDEPLTEDEGTLDEPMEDVTDDVIDDEEGS
jgi:hypothetical protein